MSEDALGSVGLVESATVMAPFGREILERLSARGETLVLMIDQT